MTGLTKTLKRLSEATDENGRQLVVKLNADQTISIKPKGTTLKRQVTCTIRQVYTMMRNMQNV